MDQDTRSTLTAAHGEALFASFLQTAILADLVARGIIDRAKITDAMDEMLLILEKYQVTSPHPDAVAYARARLSSLIPQLPLPRDQLSEGAERVSMINLIHRLTLRGGERVAGSENGATPRR